MCFLRSFFADILLPIGTFQDGDLREHRNPTSLASWKVQQVWRAEIVFDVIPSLGTGTAVEGLAQALAQRDTWKHELAPRFVRSWLIGMDGEVQVRPTANTVNIFNADTRAGWFRLQINSNVRLDDALLARNSESSLS